MKRSILHRLIIKMRVAPMLVWTVSYSCNLVGPKSFEMEYFVRAIRKVGDGITHVSAISFHSYAVQDGFSYQ